MGCTAERANRHSGHSVPVHMHAGPWTLRTSNLAFVPHAAHSNNSLASPQAACLPLSSTNPFPNHNPPLKPFRQDVSPAPASCPPHAGLHPESQTRSIPSDCPAHALPSGPSALSLRLRRALGLHGGRPAGRAHPCIILWFPTLTLLRQHPPTPACLIACGLQTNPLAVTMGLSTHQSLSF